MDKEQLIDGIRSVRDTDTNGLKWEDDIKKYLSEAIDGYTIVPEEPTEAMMKNGTVHTRRMIEEEDEDEHLHKGLVIAVYKAMLTAHREEGE